MTRGGLCMKSYGFSFGCGRPWQWPALKTVPGDGIIDPNSETAEAQDHHVALRRAFDERNKSKG